ncbi:MAG TPA: fibronectin type III domain-containing protein, partial [Longimicrobiales bacterium]|nr:fibronectin type III domain-containing protein [Longimicrobiales bacterium]
MAAIVVVLSCGDVVTVVEVARIDVVPATASVQVGHGTEFTARAIGPGGETLTGRAVTWRTLDPEVAQVNGSGTVHGMAPGDATIEATSGTVSGTAVVTVTPAPRIALGATEVSFSAVAGGSAPPDRTIAVQNDGGSTLTGLEAAVRFPDGTPDGWLATSIGATAPATLLLSVSSAGLAPGSYTAFVDVSALTADNSPVTLTVTLIVSPPPPAIGTEPTSLAFSGRIGADDPTAQTVQITNTGGGTVTGLTTFATYPGDQTGGWLSLSLNRSTAPATLTARVRLAGLTAGMYTASISIASATAGNGPHTLPVTLHVLPPALPGAPSAFVATALDTVTIDLEWTASAGVVDGYHIERSTTPGSGFVPLDSVAGGVTGFEDTGLANGTTYYYRVRARNVSGFSNYSAVASATTPVPPPPVPGAPGNPAATALDTVTIEFQWTASAGVVDEYHIERSTTPGGGFVPVDTVAGGVTTFQDSGLQSGTTYYYRVRARNISGFSSYSAVASATTPVPPPPAPGVPTGLSAAAMDTATIRLTWTASAGVVDAYHIERSTTPGSGFTEVGTVPGSVTAFQNSGLESGTAHYYRVRARNVSGFSNYSAEVSATTPLPPPPLPGAPANLAATALDTGTIRLTWTASAGVVDTYHIERSTTAGSGFAAVATVDGGVSAFQDTGLASATSYYYRVRARNVSGFSNYSAEASATTPVPPPPVPGAPTELSATARGIAAIELNWTASAGVVDGYYIERSTAPGSGFAPVDTVAGGVM